MVNILSQYITFDIILLSIPIVILIYFIYYPRNALSIFFLLKFTIDLLWNYSLFGFSITPLHIWGILFLLLCIIYYFQNKPSFLKHPLTHTILILLLLNIISSIWGYINSYFEFFPLVASPLTLKNILDWNIRFLSLSASVLFLPLIFNKENDFKFIIKIFVISTIIPNIAGFINYFNTLEKGKIYYDLPYSVTLFPRITSGYHDAAVYAIILFVSISGSFYLILQNKNNYYKILLSLYFIFSLFMLYNTYSRTIWLSFIFFVLTFFIIKKSYWYSIVILIIIILFFILNPVVHKRFEREINYISNKNLNNLNIKMTGTGRVGLWQQAYDHYIKLDFVSNIIGTGGSYGSHNQYILWILRNGLVGLIFYLIFLYNIFFLLCKNLKNQFYSSTDTYFIFSLFFILISITSLFIQIWDNISFNYYFWGLLGITITNYSAEQRKKFI